MKKTFQKTLIAAATGVALLSAVGTANANSLLFPYFTTEAGNTSIVSLSGNDQLSVAPAETIHYVYNYGSSCTHFDGNGSMTANDLLQHSVASVAAGGFGKVVASDASAPFYFPLKDYGFLTVTTKTTATAQISGDMIVYNPTAGIVTSYPGIDNAIVNTTVAGSEGNFINLVDTKFNLSFYPTSLVTTSWYGVVTGDMSGAIAIGADWGGKAALANGGGVYDNDENLNSGAKSKTLTCSGIVLPKDLMNSAQEATVGPNGGLIHATATPDAATLATGIVMTKIQIVPAAKAGLLHREAAPAF